MSDLSTNIVFLNNAFGSRGVSSPLGRGEWGQGHPLCPDSGEQLLPLPHQADSQDRAPLKEGHSGGG
eukprot:CAMPEP_0177614190 /NCGR_PEP_ID=MMETSP0419_2-20121207/22520_1 /TAXON_ID=582737 /ORGANISM="Tetraselmis sp., Strain GSL018" /LENGTH=66 /DNA_ID=CAMNT_0019111225 /DNA_START=91 /DNA_END=288 /DNA_ORIENTATION=-